jgi:hypothetical protein
MEDESETQKYYVVVINPGYSKKQIIVDFKDYPNYGTQQSFPLFLNKISPYSLEIPQDQVTVTTAEVFLTLYRTHGLGAGENVFIY